MPNVIGSDNPDGDEPKREPTISPTRNYLQFQQWYDVAIRLRDEGRDEEALDYFKRIYEIDYNYKDVAVIVESSYQ